MPKTNPKEVPPRHRDVEKAAETKRLSRASVDKALAAIGRLRADTEGRGWADNRCGQEAGLR